MSNIKRIHLEELFFSIVSKCATKQDYEYFFACNSKSLDFSSTSYINKIHCYLLSNLEKYLEDISFNKSSCINLVKDYLIKLYHSLTQHDNLPSSRLSTVIKMVEYYNLNKSTTSPSSFEISALNILLEIQHKMRLHKDLHTAFTIAKPLLLTIFAKESVINSFLSLEIDAQSITATYNVNETINEKLSILCGINAYLDIISHSLKEKCIEKLFKEIKQVNDHSLSNHITINLLVEYIIESFSYENIRKLIEKYISKENSVNYYVGVCYFINKMKDKINKSLVASSSKTIDPKLITAISTLNNVNRNIIYIPNIISIGLFYPSIGTFQYFSNIYKKYNISQYLSRMNDIDNISLHNYYIILLHMIYETQNKQHIIESTLTNKLYDVFFDLSKILSFSKRFISLVHSFHAIEKYIPSFPNTVYKEGRTVQLTPQIHQTKSTTSIETISSTIDYINKEYSSQNICVFHTEATSNEKEYLFIIKSFPANEKVINMLTINNNNFVLVACYDNGRDIAYYLIENNKWYYSDTQNKVVNAANVNVFIKNKNKNELRLIYMKIDTCNYYCYNKMKVNALKTYSNIQEVELLVSVRYLVTYNSAFLNKWASVYKDIISKYAKLIGDYILDNYKENEDLNEFVLEHILPQLKDPNLNKKLNNKIFENKNHNK